MTEFLCSRGGKPPTEADLAAVKAFGEFLKAAGPASPVHACPPDDAGLTPCCGRTPFELPPSHRMTLDAEKVTCDG